MRTRFINLFSEFFKSEQASGIILILCTITSIAVANSASGEGFIDFWHTKIGFDSGPIHLKLTLEHWINDGLMAIFFLLIGLEIERELYIGELSNPRKAILPIFAALGGMATPAFLYFLFNRGTETAGGIGIPMATDIAFALGALSLLGRRIPLSLKVFLTALAIIDDLGAIVMIALFYVGDFSFLYFALSIGIFLALLAINRLGVRHLAFYLIPGAVMWYCMVQSGVHATLSGVLLAFAIPFGQAKEISPSYKLQHFLHRPVAFLIMPIFAIANTGIILSGNLLAGLGTPNSMGILAGLILGKPIGIVAFTWLSIRLGLSQLPNKVDWLHVLGAGFLAGIGFTMSIFITLLAFTDAGIVQNSKIAILTSSLIAGSIGLVILRLRKDKPVHRHEHRKHEPTAETTEPDS